MGNNREFQFERFLSVEKHLLLGYIFSDAFNANYKHNCQSDDSQLGCRLHL